MTADAAAAAVLDDPGQAYTDEVKSALIEAMITYGAIPIADDQWLTIAARDNEDSRLGGDPYDVSTIILRIRGDELAAYRAGRITKQDVLKRVRGQGVLARGRRNGDEGGNNRPDPVSKRVEYAPMRTRLALVLLAALVATSCSGVDLKTSSRLDPTITGWFDAGVTSDGKNKLVPSITFTLTNTGQAPLGTIEINCVFKRKGDPEEWSTVLLLGSQDGPQRSRARRDQRSDRRPRSHRLHRHRGAVRHPAEPPLRGCQGRDLRQARGRALGEAGRVLHYASAPHAIAACR